MPLKEREVEHYMREAIKLARKGQGWTSPNPAVGAVVVKNGRVVGRGFHKKAGLPHAEVEAIRDAGKRARGGMLFVTLEPCVHYGRTPPCTSSIIEAGIKEVFIGHIDPNPIVRGKGVETLREHGIKVHTGILEGECRELNRGYIKFMEEGMPFVTLKMAVTLNGKFYIPSRKYISSENALRFVHRLRAIHDVVLTGGNTVRIDDPFLTVRYVKGHQPARGVISRALSIPPDANVFREGGERFLFVPSGVNGKKEVFTERGVDVVEVEREGEGISLKGVLKYLAKRNFMSVLLECGENLAGAFIREGLVDRYVFLTSPIVTGMGFSLFSAGEWMRELRVIKTMKKGGEIIIIGEEKERCSQE